ncbi:hypothetical protein AMTRI_Chr11g153040 [Amborella trichopoda]
MLMEDSLQLNPGTMDQGSISSGVAVVVCMTMALSYVLVLYAPTFMLRLPPPLSLEKEACLCLHFNGCFTCRLCLPPPYEKILECIVNLSHIWHSTRPFGSKKNPMGKVIHWPVVSLMGFFERISSLTSNVLAWRNYVGAPLIEELVFRASHVNRLLELYYDQRISFSMSVGLQQGYTVIFGCYTSFLFIRTGHLAAPISAHVFCNVMGLPLISSTRGKATSRAFMVGALGFFVFLLPATHPGLYNTRTEHCNCWHGYCNWN